MSTPSPERTAQRVFGSDSWDWIRDRLSALKLDFGRARDSIVASTIIEASHGDPDRFDDLLSAAEIKSLPIDLHREWLAVERNYNVVSGYTWFIEVIRDIAPLAIEQKLHPVTSHFDLLIDRFGQHRSETIVVAPLRSAKVHLCNLENRRDSYQNSDSVSPSSVRDHIIPLLAVLPIAE